MGEARDAYDAATVVAEPAYITWAEAVSGGSDGSGALSATAEGMDPANSAAVNTAALAAMLTKAGRDRKIVFDKSGTYQISDEFGLDKAGLTIEAANSIFVRLQQVTANKHIFMFEPDTTYDFPINIGTTLRGLRLQGPGGGTTGVGLWSDPLSGTYQGARLTLEDIHVHGFDIGARLHRFDNLSVRDIYFRDCRVGWHSSGNANTIHLENAAASTMSECGFIFGDGFGVTFKPGDIISSPKAIRCLNGSNVVIIGGNMESISGTEGHIDIESGAKVIGIGNRFLKGTVETPGYRVALANLVAIAPTFNGFTTAPIVKKTDGGAVTVVLSPSTNLSGTDRLLETQDGATTMLGHSPFPNRIDNSVPAAAVQYRGLVLHKVTRDSVSAEDGLYWYGKDRSSGADVYTQRVLTGVIEGTGSPEGAVTARVGRMYARLDGGTDTSLYIKSSGTGNTGWRAVTTAAP